MFSSVTVGRRACALAAAVLSIGVASAGTAQATGDWHQVDLVAVTNAPLGGNFIAPSAFITALPGQGSIPRIVYTTRTGDVELLSQDADGWRAEDLTSETGAPSSAGSASGFSTDLTFRGPEAHVVYTTVSGGVEDLYLDGTGWHALDLTATTGAPASVSTPSGNTTDTAGYGTIERVDYRTGGGHVEEITQDSAGWHAFDMTALTGADSVVDGPFGFASDPSLDGVVGRIVSRTGDGHVQQLSLDSVGWRATDLTAKTGADPIVVGPLGYTSNATGKGPEVRIVALASNLDVQELSLDALGWHDTDVTIAARAAGNPRCQGRPSGYATGEPSQGPAARVVCMMNDGHLEELALYSGVWHFTRLSGFATAGDPFGYTANLIGPIPFVGFVAMGFDGHVVELYRA